MIGNFRMLCSFAIHSSKNLLWSDSIQIQQFRSTYILKRRHQPPLPKIGQPQKNLRPKYFIYDMIKNTVHEKKPNLNLVLTKYVEGVGKKGDEISVRPNYGYNKLLLPGLAVYATPENVEKYKTFHSTEEVQHSSPYAPLIVQHLSKIVLSVVMNKETPWTINPWHIKTSFRKCNYTVPEETITMPNNPINGPNMELEGKEFYVVVTINNLEQANVRCKIHHWSTKITDRIPYVPEFWKLPSEPVFLEDKEVLDSMPKKQTLIRKSLNK